MTDSYQPIYDAMRRALGHIDVSGSIERAFDISFQKARLQEALVFVEGEMTRPSVLFRPSIAPDGNKWSVLYGSNIAEGVTGYGDTPAEAMAAFDQAWYKKRPPMAAVKP